LDSKFYTETIYSLYDFIDEESFELIYSKLDLDYKKNSYVMNNKEYIKKLINKKNEEFIYSLSPSIVDNEILDIIYKK